ncbi:hypothetical protein AAHA92_28702 [Salvia divinorum]|uniref:Uncharacterized protein n=1 Tax=Salvia divinorum TaxID=28513 RepID=A0ABD1FVW9_SALDI
MEYTETLRDIISILRAASDDTEGRIMHTGRLETEQMNAGTVLSKIEKYGYVFKVMRLGHLLFFGVIVILLTVIASKNPNDEYAKFFKNTGPFLFTISFALLEVRVRKNLLDLHEMEKTIIWSRKVIEFTRGQPLPLSLVLGESLYWIKALIYFSGAVLVYFSGLIFLLSKSG